MPFRTRASIDPNSHKGLIALNSISGNALVVTGASLTNSQPLHVAVVDGSGSQVTSFGGSTISTSSYPMYDRRDLGGYALGTDSAGALQTFSMVTTDAGTGRANFTGSSISSSPGTATFTNGSTAVTGTGFTTTDVFYLDYIKLGSDSETAWAQVGFINSDTSITLNAPYTGTGGTGTYNLSPVATVTGTGATISVASGQATVGLGTNTSASTVLYRAAGVPPIRNFLFSTQASISQRVANQDIYIGLESATSSARYFSRFHFTSTVNTTVITETGYNPTGVPTASETETNTVTLPAAAVTSSVNTYKIVSEVENVYFYINSVLVATHSARMPHVAAQTMNAQIRGLNSGAVTNTNIVSNYIYARPYERLEVSPNAIQVVDTELPAATALSDTLANPTTPMIGGANLLWDAVGAQWVRQIQTPADSSNLQTGVGAGRNTLLLRRTTSDYRTLHTADAGTDGLAGANQASTSPMIYNGSTFDRTRTASGDTLAATGLLGGGNMLFNSSSWDRQRSGVALADGNNATGVAATAGWGYNGTTWDRSRNGAVSNVAAATGYADTLSVGQYNATPPTITDTRYNTMQMDVNANTRVTLATLIAGEDLTANVQGVIQKPVTGSTYAPSTYQQSASVTKANIKASAGNAYMIRITNGNAAVRYFQLHNKATAPAGTDVPQLYFIVPAGTATSPGIFELNTNDFAPTEYFSTGIGWAISTTATTFTDSATASDHNTTVRYV